MVPASIFKAYDIRGVYPSEINEDGAYRIAQAYAKFLGAKRVVLGRDVRVSGGSLFAAAAKGLTDHGVEVIDIGVVTTDMMYFAAAKYLCDGGVTISASHNPAEYNGMKLVRAGALPISGDTGIGEIRDIAAGDYRFIAPVRGEVVRADIAEDYLEKCLSFIDPKKLRSQRVVANAMFGPVLQNVLRAGLPLTLFMLNEVPDGTFPKGQPDPMQSKNREETIAAIREHNPDFGAAWDADADRFFIFDETGRFVPGYYLTAFLGAYFAAKQPGAKVIHDPRLTWAIEDAVRGAGGEPIANKSGHSFIKERMRKEDAIFAGEASGHFYFKDFFYSDNGLIPFLVMLQIISESGKKVSELFEPYFRKYPVSGEINLKLKAGDTLEKAWKRVRVKYADASLSLIDGLSLEYQDWRANIRGSNTEPVVRLNVEARNPDVLKSRTLEIQGILAS